MKTKKRNPVFICGLLAAAVVLLLFLSVRYGSVYLNNAAFFGGLFRREGFRTAELILHLRRIPRALAGLFAGAGLAVSGVLLQNVTGNPLCGPNIIGVNAGAGFAVILCLSAAPAALYVLPAAAFAGAFLTAIVITVLSDRAGRSKNTIILAGIACTSVYQAGISFLSLLDTDVLVSYNSFSVGGLAEVTAEELPVPCAVILFCLAASLLLARRISALSLGDAVASSLGVSVRRLRVVCLLLASASAAAVVSYAGLLGFVGLMVPHIARKLVGQGIGRQLICASLAGASVVILADLIGRILVPPTEIPVGILMALVGAPFFFVLLLTRKENHSL